MSNQNPNLNQTNQATRAESTADVPATVGGRSVTGFTTAGVSVQIASRKEELEADLLERQLQAAGKIRLASIFNPGRSQYLPPRRPPEGRI